MSNQSDQADLVNHPAHYTFGAIEVIDAIEAWGLGYHLGNVVKYCARAAHKGNELQDLRKAAWYLARWIEGIEAAKVAAETPSNAELRAIAEKNPPGEEWFHEAENTG